MDYIDVNETQRYSVYFDDEMHKHEAIIKEDMKRQGVKPSRSNMIRWLMAQEVKRIERRKGQKEGGD